MGFRGDLKHISLADVFQNISSNRLTGTLRIFSEKEERYIFFGEGEITLFAPGGQKKEWAIGALIKQKKLNPSQKDTALKTKKKTRKLLRQVLSELKIISPQDYSQTLQIYMEEEIYEVFFWKNAQFEFQEGEAPPLFDEDLVAANIKIDSYTVIMEAARRMDEWETIRQQITSPEDIFRAKEVANLSELDPLVQALLPLLDGTRTLNQITDALPYGKFDIYQQVYQLLSQGLVQPIQVGELLKLVDQYLEENKNKRAIALLKRVLERERNNQTARQKLAETLEAEDQLSPASDEYKIMAYQYLSDHELTQAIHCYRRAVVLDPTDTATQEKLLGLYLEHNKLDRALLAGRALASTYQELGMPLKAIRVYENLLLYLDTPEIHLFLAKASLLANREEDGKKHYYQAAKLYLKNKDEKGALEAYQLAGELEPDDENEASRRIEEIQSGKYQKRKHFLKRLVLILMITPILVSGAFFILYESLARSQYHKSLSKSMEHLYGSEISSAYYDIYPICKAYPYSLSSRSAQENLLFLSSMTLKEAKKAEKEGHFPRALYLYSVATSFPIQAPRVKEEAQQGYLKWKEGTSPVTAPISTGSKKAVTPKIHKTPSLLPLLKEDRESLQKYFEKVVWLIQNNRRESARKALKKFIPFLEELPKKLRRYYLPKAQDLLDQLGSG